MFASDAREAMVEKGEDDLGLEKTIEEFEGLLDDGWVRFAQLPNGDFGLQKWNPFKGKYFRGEPGKDRK
jgi:hypothetical protein